ncbi:hypothetical protein Tco_0365445 [Tanacetum coccineum]
MEEDDGDDGDGKLRRKRKRGMRSDDMDIELIDGDDFLLLKHQAYCSSICREENCEPLFETDESAATPPPHPAYQLLAYIFPTSITRFPGRVVHYSRCGPSIGAYVLEAYIDSRAESVATFTFTTLPHHLSYSPPPDQNATNHPLAHIIPTSFPTIVYLPSDRPSVNPTTVDCGYGLCPRSQVMSSGESSAAAA